MHGGTRHPLTGAVSVRAGYSGYSGYSGDSILISPVAWAAGLAWRLGDTHLIPGAPARALRLMGEGIAAAGSSQDELRRVTHDGRLPRLDEGRSRFHPPAVPGACYRGVIGTRGRPWRAAAIRPQATGLRLQTTNFQPLPLASSLRPQACLPRFSIY